MATSPTSAGPGSYINAIFVHIYFHGKHNLTFDFSSFPDSTKEVHSCSSYPE